jgi:lipoprotein-releasing system ATP-binding protein
LQIIGTLDRADKGSIHINNRLIQNLSDRQLSEFRNKEIGFVFQFHHLLPEFTAIENICIPAFIAKTSKREAEKEAMKLMEFLGLQDRADHKPSELSGGEQQRIAVARALINKPSVILADEPSGNLDSNSAVELHQLFFRLRDEFKQTFVLVTHNTELANMSDRIFSIKDGIIEN